MGNLLANVGRLAMFFAFMTPLLQAQWVNVGGPSNAMGFYSYTFAAWNDSVGNSFILAASEDSPNVYLSTDHGSTWQTKNNGLTTSAISSLQLMNGTVFVGTPDGVFVSTDKGAHWIQRNTGMANIAPWVRPFAVLDSFIFAAQATTVYRSSDMGLNWTAVGSNGLWGLIERLAATDSILVASTNSWLFISSDYGETWTRQSLPGNLWGLATRSPNIFAGSYDDAGGLFRSTDNGATWSQPERGSSMRFSSLCASATHLFAGTPSGIFLSQNDGASWTSFDEINLVDCSALLIWDGYLFAGCHGFWRRSLSDVSSSVNEKLDQVVASYRLDQNFPNPFNPTTTIRFQLPIRLHVRLVIYDLLGRVMSSVLDEVKDAGSYEVLLDANGLCSGTYFYHLESAVGTQTRKMMLVR